MALEDFTGVGWVESDAGGRLTVTATSITWNDVLRGDEACYVRADKGAAFFNGDFTHSFEFTTPSAAESADGAWVYMWVLSNHATQAPSELESASSDYLGFYFVNATGDIPRFALSISDDGVRSDDNSSTINYSTKYYVTIVRDDAGGVNGTGQLTAYICTTNYYGDTGYSLFDTLTLDCGAGEQNDYRYIFATIPRGGTGTQITDGVVENLNLSAVANVFVDMEVTSGGVGDGTATMELFEAIDMAVTSGGTGGGSATMTVVGSITGLFQPTFILVSIGHDELWYEDI